MNDEIHVVIILGDTNVADIKDGINNIPVLRSTSRM
jgi:hypothetical protein